MDAPRREFLKHVGFLTAASTGLVAAQQQAGASDHPAGPADPMGVLVDLTACVGCRLCEYACKKANGFETGALESYDDQSVFQTKRRPSTTALTVVNSWRDPADPAAKPVYTKVNCFHCTHPACASACIVGALRKQDNGAVTYETWKCIGCRYCMIACPFQVPAYEYENVLTPQVRKCQFCFERTTDENGQPTGAMPACAKACPRQVMTYGKRNELIALAHDRVARHPDRYIDHVYGEHEVGGTSWMYLSAVPFEQAGFLTVGTAAPPVLTEAIQHGVFKYWIAPVGWYGFLATAMWYTGRRRKVQHEEHAAAHEAPTAVAAAHGHRHLLEQAEGSTEHDDETAVALMDAPADEPVGDDGAASAPHPEPLSRAAKSDISHGDVSNTAHANHGHSHAAPVDHMLLTPGVWALIAMVAVGAVFWLYRFVVGLGASTNLDQQHPWGLWIAMDVGSGIALAGGGFVTAALVHIFHREHYEPIARSALLTALLGYTFYVPGLLADIGRWYNIWHPNLPNMWQGNSVLFEVGICVMIYLNVQYAEITPIICQRLLGENWFKRYPRLYRLTQFTHDKLEKIMPALLVLGVCLSTFHQSSLGNLMVIAPYKLHQLWWTPVSPLLFLLSAMMVGFPMVIFTILFASWALRREPEMQVLAPLSRYVPLFLSVYLAVKVGDMLVRGTHTYLFDGSLQSISFIVEMLGGVVVPLAMLLRAKVRRSPRLLATACLLVILGVVLNRLNVLLIGYQPPYAQKGYFPSIPEFAVSLGLVAALLLTYRVAVTYLPILEPRRSTAAADLVKAKAA